jgi:serine/threonine-protein kinase
MADSSQPEATQACEPASDALDSVLAAAFGPDSGPPLPASGSVVQALRASLPAVPSVHLREPREEMATPVNLPRSPEMPVPVVPSGRLQLVGEIARGGMGAVFKGRDVDLGRDVAVKVLLETHRGRVELAQRFVEEAQITGQLQHPGVAPVYELGVFPDLRPYFTMKLVKGKTLSALLHARQGPADDLPKLLGVFEQVCQTLAYAHARGVIHRDLKPSNVMVGAFGEVQVMDWGLAKVLAEGGVADEAKARERREATVIHTQRSLGSAAQEGQEGLGSQTQAGSVLGTPAYMAPEQARGDVALVDERADVFGLGAILCEVLTGEPPFTGKAAEVQRKAQTALLGDAYARLDGCGADAELVALAKYCLAPEPWERPAHAGEVAQGLTEYGQSVACRLRQAELDRAAAEARAVEEARTREMAEARAAEERKRRRTTLALAAAVLALVVIGGGGAAWWWRERTAAARDVEAALAEAAAHQAAGRWPEARAALERADGRLAGAGPAQLRERLRQAQADARVVAELEEVRFRPAEAKGGKGLDFSLATERYPVVFREYGISTDLPAEAAAALVRASVVREELLAALDDWQRARGGPLMGYSYRATDTGEQVMEVIPGSAAGEDGRLRRGDRIVAIAEGDGPLVSVVGKGATEVGRLFRGRPGSVVRLVVMPSTGGERRVIELTRGGRLAGWLAAVVAAADDNPWRRDFRQVVAAGNAGKVRELARQPQALDQPPAVLVWLSAELEQAGLRDEAVTVLRRGHDRYPGDFWINYDLGEFLTWGGAPGRPEEVGYWRAAVALRPACVAARNGLGVSLLRNKDPQGAVSELRGAIALDPKAWAAYVNLGAALGDAGDRQGAIKALRMAIELRPTSALAHYLLGRALAQKKEDLEAAIAACRRAVALDPQDTDAHTALGVALRTKGDQDGAAAAFAKAVEVDANNASAREELIKYLAPRGRLEELRASWEKALTKGLPEYDAWSGYAELCLYLGNVDAYRRARRDLLAAFARTTDPEVAERAGRACLLLPAEGDELERAAALPDRAEALGRSHEYYEFFRLAKGLAEYRRGRYAEALAILEATSITNAQRKLTEPLVLARLGRRDEALAVLNAILVETDWSGAGWVAHDVWIAHVLRREAEALILPDVDAWLKGDSQPRRPEDWLALASVCRARGLYATGAQRFAEALRADLKPANDVMAWPRFNAACLAALAGCGRGKDAGQLGERERVRLRKKALAWLRADLAAWAKIAEAPAGHDRTRSTLLHWQEDAELAGIRDTKEVAKLSAAEQAECRKLWADVKALLKNLERQPE